MTNSLIRAPARRQPLGAALFGRAREAVIGLLFLDPNSELHVRELARRAGLAASTIAHELKALQEAGVLNAEARGAQLFFRANPDCPLFEELKSIAVKTWGISGRVEAALKALHNIDCAFIYGSFAKGTANPQSDVDVLVIGSAEFSTLHDAVSEATRAIGRVVSPKLYRPDEWKRKMKEGNSFVRAIAAEPKLFLVGNEEVLNAIGKSGEAGTKQRLEPASAQAAGNRKPPRRGARLRKGGSVKGSS